jgi:hypothetical protein
MSGIRIADNSYDEVLWMTAKLFDPFELKGPLAGRPLHGWRDLHQGP